MEQVSEAKAFIGLYPVNTLFEPIDVKGPDSHRVIARCFIGLGMGPDVYAPTPAFVMPPMVDVFSRCQVEDGQEFFLGVVQVNIVGGGFHDVSLAAASCSSRRNGQCRSHDIPYASVLLWSN